MATPTAPTNKTLTILKAMIEHELSIIVANVHPAAGTVDANTPKPSQDLIHQIAEHFKTDASHSHMKHLLEAVTRLDALTKAHDYASKHAQ